MAGILDKKQRVIDYKLTNNGRSQIQNGDIRYVYATFSDSSIVYNKKEKDLIDSKLDISDESQFLPFEVSTKVNDELNPEFDLKNFMTSDENSFVRIDTTSEEINFSDAIQKIKDSNTIQNNISLSKKLESLKFLDSYSEKEVSSITFSNEDEVKNKSVFSFISNKYNYPTLYNADQEYSELNTLVADKRLSRKTPFKKLIPTNSQGIQLYSEDVYKKYFSDQADEYFLVKDYNKIVEGIVDDDSPEDCVIKTVKSLIDNPKVYKKEYILRDYSNKDVFIFNMYENELNIDGDINEYSINKLSFIDMGDIIDKNDKYRKKRVFLIGKIIKTRNSENVDIDLVYSFNKGVIQKNTRNNQIPLSIYYSFINMFILVLE